MNLSILTLTGIIKNNFYTTEFLISCYVCYFYRTMQISSSVAYVCQKLRKLVGG